ncbi:DUF721 domain-containing protein [bacterium]|nr:DUF721 domain-containing protein [bacterium]
MKKTPVKTVGIALEELLSSLGIDNRVHEQVVIAEFERVMGDTFCKRASAVKIERGVLFIEVTSSVWRQELFYQKQMIKQRLNDALGETLVKEIIFR